MMREARARMVEGGEVGGGVYERVWRCSLCLCLLTSSGGGVGLVGQGRKVEGRQGERYIALEV